MMGAIEIAKEQVPNADELMCFSQGWIESLVRRVQVETLQFCLDAIEIERMVHREEKKSTHF